MTRKIIYWVSTGLVAALSIFAAFTYLSGSPQAVQGFAHVGYPQQLRIILGIAKTLGAIALIVPGMAVLKEWAYAGFTLDRKSTRLNSSHANISYAVFCLKKKKKANEL